MLSRLQEIVVVVGKIPIAGFLFVTVRALNSYKTVCVLRNMGYHKKWVFNNLFLERNFYEIDSSFGSPHRKTCQ